VSFRLVPKSVTLNDPEGRNGRYLCVFSANSVAFGAHCVKVVEDVVVKSSRSLSHLLMSFLLAGVRQLCLLAKLCPNPTKPLTAFIYVAVLEFACTFDIRH